MNSDKQQQQQKHWYLSPLQFEQIIMKIIKLIVKKHIYKKVYWKSELITCVV